MPGILYSRRGTGKESDEQNWKTVKVVRTGRLSEEVLPPASRMRSGRALDNDWGLKTLGRSQVHVKRTKQKAVLPRGHREFSPPFPLQEMITSVTRSCYIVSTEAQVSPYMEPET